MKLFPDSKAARIRAAVIFAMFLGACYFANIFSLRQLSDYQPHEGDILFQSLPRNPLVDAIEGVTQSVWSHCGVVMRKDGSWIVCEAIGTVRETPLALWVIRGRSGFFAAYRLKPDAYLPGKTGFTRSLASALAAYMGRPYDFRYAPGDAEIYCSELVFKAYRNAVGLELGTWEKLGNLNWQPHENFIRAMENGGLPLERPMITPVGITRSSLLSRVYQSAL